MPNLPTTMPPARLAIGIASRRLRPAASIAASVAITVSPAPVTSNTSRASAGTRAWPAASNSDMPSSERVTSRPSRPSSARSRSARSAQLRLARPAADHLGQLGAVRRDHGGALVARVVVALRVDEHRLAGGAGLLDHRRDVRQAALAVVGEQDRVRDRAAPPRRTASMPWSTSWSGSSSKSTRRSCCERPMTRSLTMVVRPGSRSNSDSMPLFSSSVSRRCAVLVVADGGDEARLRAERLDVARRRWPRRRGAPAPSRG